MPMSESEKLGYMYANAPQGTKVAFDDNGRPYYQITDRRVTGENSGFESPVVTDIRNRYFGRAPSIYGGSVYQSQMDKLRRMYGLPPEAAPQAQEATSRFGSFRRGGKGANREPGVRTQPAPINYTRDGGTYARPTDPTAPRNRGITLTNDGPIFPGAAPVAPQAGSGTTVDPSTPDPVPPVAPPVTPPVAPNNPPPAVEVPSYNYQGRAYQAGPEMEMLRRWRNR